MKLTTQYKLEFKKVNGAIHIVANSKEYEILAQFLDYWNSVEDIEEDLLPEVDGVLNGTFGCCDIGADVVGLAYVETEHTKLMGSDIGYADLELATTDFKVLILEWVNIIKESKGKSILGLAINSEEE